MRKDATNGADADPGDLCDLSQGMEPPVVAAMGVVAPSHNLYDSDNIFVVLF